MRKCFSLLMLMLIVMSVPAMADVTQVLGDKATKSVSSSKDETHHFVVGTGSDQKVYKITVVKGDAASKYAEEKATLPAGAVEISNDLANFALKHPELKITQRADTTTYGIKLGILDVQSTNAVSKVLIGVKVWTGSLDKLDVKSEKLYYLGKEVVPSVGANGEGIVLSVVGKPGVTYTVSGQTAVYDDGTSIKIMDTKGRVFETMTKDEYAALQYNGKISDLVILSSKFRQQGAQLAGAEKIAGGYVASSAFARDVAMSDDGQFIIKGDFATKDIDIAKIKAGDLSSLKSGEVEINQYSFNGELISRKVYESASSGGQRMSTEYSYSDTKWSSVRYSTDGTKIVDSEHSYAINKLKDGTILVEITSGVWVNSNNLEIPVDKATGEALTGETAVSQQEKLDKLDEKQRDAYTQLKKQHVKDNPSELDALYSYWRNVWRTAGTGGFFDKVFGAGGIDSFLAFAGELLKGYQQYQGIASLGGLFMKDQIGAWREKVDDAFCKAMLGSECIAQKMCEKYGDSANTDIVIATTYPGTGIRAAAHIQAERSQPSFFTDEEGKHQQYLYRVTYFAASPKTDNSVQITFHSSGGQYDWYPEPQDVSKGGVVSAQGGAALVKYSAKNYDSVCLTFQTPIDTGTGGSERQLCVPIVTSGVTPSGENTVVKPGEESESDVAITDTTDDEEVEDVPEAQAQPGDGF